MRLPRWLSSVRTVEAATGWPRPLCRRFARRVARQRPPDGRSETDPLATLLLLILVFGALIGMGAGAALAATRSST